MGWMLLAAALVLLFWVVGGYKRLVSLRNAISEAWARLAEALAPREAVAGPLVALLRTPLAAEQRALDGFLAAAAQARQGAAALGSRPLDAALARQWVAAEALLATAAARVLALVQQDGTLAESPEIAPLLSTWADSSAKRAYARQRFNEAATAYNEAIALFPTRLLAQVFGMVAVGTL
jgi:LemA protein